MGVIFIYFRKASNKVPHQSIYYLKSHGMGVSKIGAKLANRQKAKGDSGRETSAWTAVYIAGCLNVQFWDRYFSSLKRVTAEYKADNRIRDHSWALEQFSTM